MLQAPPCVCASSPHPPLQGSKAFPSSSLEEECTPCKATNSFCAHHFMTCKMCVHMHQEPPCACAPSSTLCVCIKAPPLQGPKAFSPSSMEKEYTPCKATNCFCAHHFMTCTMCVHMHQEPRTDLRRGVCQGVTIQNTCIVHLAT